MMPSWFEQNFAGFGILIRFGSAKPRNILSQLIIHNKIKRDFYGNDEVSQSMKNQETQKITL